MRLVTEDSVSRMAIRKAATRPTIASAVPSFDGQVLRVDERAADAVGEVLARSSPPTP